MRVLALVWLCSAALSAQPNRGYYRFPAIHGDTIAFTSEGDLWTVSARGGTARRLTTHPGEESYPTFSPDGKTIAFAATYEGPIDVYTVPSAGGMTARRTWDGGARPVGWTAEGKLMVATRRFATLPDTQLATIDAGNRQERVPLSQAADGVYDAAGALYFTRLPFQGSYAKRYKGGEVQTLWKYTAGQEAIPLTASYAGTSKNPMWWNGRLYFLSDRDGTMNLWSADAAGRALKQHTKQQGWDIQSASLQGGRIVYQLSGDIHMLDIASGRDQKLDIAVESDFDHLREHWVRNPMEFLTAWHVAPDGKRVALISRGRAFVAPVKEGRFVEIPSSRPGRYRDARFTPDGKSLLLLSTESGEVEIWKAPANGTAVAEPLSSDGKILRWEAIPSPDGKWIAHQDKNGELWLMNAAERTSKRIAKSEAYGGAEPMFQWVRWSPDSRWLLYSRDARNGFGQVMVYDTTAGVEHALTTDRYENSSAAWSADGKWIYLISDRSLHTVVFAPWGTRQPEPFYDKPHRIYAIPLQKGLRSPFEVADELHPDPAAPAKKDDKTPVKVEIDFDRVAERIEEIPLPPGNYSDLDVAGNRLCWLDRSPTEPRKSSLTCLAIDNKGDKPDTVMEEVRSFEVSTDGKKILLRRDTELLVVNADAKGAGLRDAKVLSDARVDTRGWTFAVLPANEYKELFADAWRLHRDYFYDPNMHGIDWRAMRAKYGELVTRVRDRAELNELISQMVSELSLLHASVRPGDVRRGVEQVDLATLGAELTRDAAAGGYRVTHIYRSDPDRPDRRSPLARPGVDLQDGDVILSVNGRDTLAAGDIGELLRNQAGKQVLLRVRPKDKTEARDVLARAMSLTADADLRYHEWEYTRRLEVERAGAGKLAYVHLRAMGPGDIDQWVEQYSPIFDREGLIVDVRHNRGGNIDSWVLGRLMRKVWMYWQSRTGAQYWNMQKAFRGPMVVLCDERTSSDGEAFAEGFRRLGLGKVIGTRTWGGEVWLTGSNLLADRGVATAAEYGVFGPEGEWLIEGHGVDPDVVVDNLPHATFTGKDAQLDAAVAHLQSLLKANPVTAPKAPRYPDKSK